MSHKTYTYIEVRINRWHYMPTRHRGDATGMGEAAIEAIIKQLEKDYGTDKHTICVVQCATELPLIA